MDISKVDKNFAIPAGNGEQDLEYYDVNSAPFKVYGVTHQDGEFKRMPKSVAQTVSEGVTILHRMSAGGRVRFRTDSLKIRVYGEVDVCRMNHMASSGSSGFAVFADGVFTCAVIPTQDCDTSCAGSVTFPTKKMREITVYFPLYSCTRNVYIGLEKGATVKETKGYKPYKPIVYYGSSITQGGCASNPACAYQSFIERWTNIDYVNLGFSGNARGEKTMVEYMASLEMSAFVLDYDYNATSNEQYRESHLPCYKAIRAAHPDIPILLMSRPTGTRYEESEIRVQIMTDTYNYALQNGDKNIRMIDGHTLFGKADSTACTVDTCHPTDLGFYKMAKKVYSELKKFPNFLK